MFVSKHLRSVLLIIAVFVLVFVVVSHLVATQDTNVHLDYGAFYQRLEHGQVQSFHAVGTQASGTLANGTKYVVSIPNTDSAFVQEVMRHVKSGAVGFEQPSNTGIFTLLEGLAPILLMALLFLFLFRQAQSGGSQALSFGRSRAKMLSENRPKVTFADVAGVDEAKQELSEIVDFLKYPKKYQALGARIPKGVLLLGPPGSGKTLLARAIAGEAGVPFLSISGSDFVEMFVGVGASRVRDLFNQAKEIAPAIIFIDELDAVGRRRGAGIGSVNDEREQTLNQLLGELDGFDSRYDVIILAATNRPDVLDPALLRPGRFDRQVTVDLPDRPGREGILRIHTRHVKLGPDIDLAAVAAATIGLSGADLANLCNEAALIAARNDRTTVAQTDFWEAHDKIRLGATHTRLVNPGERKVVAYHESGHAITAWLTPGADAVQKVTIVPRGRALGMTEQIPGEERHNASRSYLAARIAVMLGGRTAEELALGEVSTGAENDLVEATALARRMVTRWGMGELGLLAFRTDEQQPFLGYEMAQGREYSEATAARIDRDVERLLGESHERVRSLLAAARDRIDALVEALLREETVDAAELKRILGPPVLPKSETAAPA